MIMCKIFGKKGVIDWGGTPTPFTDKIRKVVFDVAPKEGDIPYVQMDFETQNSTNETLFSKAGDLLCPSYYHFCKRSSNDLPLNIHANTQL